MNKVKKFFIWIVVLTILGFVLYFLAGNYTYSEGSQTGYLVKFSKKGYVFKTYEGELNLGGMNASNNSVVNNIWHFSVSDSEQGAIDSLHLFEGKVVKVYYREKVRNYVWQGETPFFVYKVERMQ
jgi:hypothetical protein